MTLPGLDQLEATPEILRLLMEGLTEEDSKWKAAPNRFSIAETLEHLSHAEGHYFRSRVEQMVEDDNPRLALYETETYAAAGQYSDRNAEDSFDHFEEQRELNLQYLRELASTATQRVGADPKFGKITVENILHEWAIHDLGHIRQIVEIIRALKYYPGLGPLQAEYKLNP